MSYNEIRDPVHNFIRLDDHERRVVDSRPFQRLRHIQQLAMTNLVYPGATHKRFEHSLGVMELASRIFDVVTDESKTKDFPQVRDLIPAKPELQYWRKVTRLAALFHDVGHLPFSHAAEDLLPNGWKHEQLTVELIRSPEMKKIWRNITPPIRPEDLMKLAVGPKHVSKTPDLEDEEKIFSDWEGILSEIITSDVFGADRMDYLLRDSLHAGVAYGHFDHYRLIDTLRILPSSHEGLEAAEPKLGIEKGGLQAAESLLWARYLMYTQVYFHPVRRIYDQHLAGFLKSWLKHGVFSTDVEDHMAITDNEVLSAMLNASRDETAAGHEDAVAILQRKHFRLVYDLQSDLQYTTTPGQAIQDRLCREFGESRIKHDAYRGTEEVADFPVLHAGDVISGRSASQAITNMPTVAVDYVFVDPEIRDRAKSFLNEHRDSILKTATQKEE